MKNERSLSCAERDKEREKQGAERGWVFPFSLWQISDENRPIS
jgi:hypothetical protein